MSELLAAVAGRDIAVDGWPTVAVVMPIRNEADHLDEAVTSVLEQDYALDFDVCLAVGPSDDGTEQVAQAIATREPRVSVVDNPTGVTPAALNRAIDATASDIVVRVDGHATLSPGYIVRAVEAMMATGAVNVGGRQVPQPESPFEAAVAAATTSFVGTGGARYRVGGEAGPVDTVFLGVFDRAAGDAVGWFDETLIRNQDYELNIRLREAGGTVWFDPELWVGYRPRSSRKALAKQYYEYGFWKAEVARRHPTSLKARQLAPLAATVALTGAMVAAVRWRRALAVPFAYGAGLMVAGRPRPAVQVVAATMHLAWGTGFIRSMIERGRSELPSGAPSDR